MTEPTDFMVRRLLQEDMSPCALEVPCCARWKKDAHLAVLLLDDALEVVVHLRSSLQCRAESLHARGQDHELLRHTNTRAVKSALYA